MKETTVCRDEGPVCEVVAAGDRKLHHASVAASERRRRRLELQRIRHTPEVNHVAKRSRCRIQDDRSAFHSDSSADSTDAPTHDGWPAAASLSRGAVSVIGRRREMEDAVAVAPALLASSTPAADADRIIGGGTAAEEDVDFFAVYDGHGGARVAEACSERLHVVLADEFRRRNGGDDARSWKDAVAASFARVDAEVTGGRAPSPAVDAADLDSPFRTVGSTAVVAVVGHRRVVVANCGDSRAVLSRAGVAVPLSTDHKPDRPDELERVEAAGGRVINWNGYRVLGVLATSRSIGDYYLKPFVSAEPEVTVVERTDQDEFLILASDGLWDVVSNEVACKIARNCLNGRAASMFPEAVSGRTAADAAALLTELAMARGSKDNISVVVVELRRLKGSS